MRRSWWAWTTLVAAMLSPATATALDDPQVAISGTPRVGATLDAVARFDDDDDDDATASYAWQQCADAATSCVAIPGAAARRYVPTAADVGRRIQVRLIVRGDDDDDGAVVVASALTEPVAAAPGAPGGSTPPLTAAQSAAAPSPPLAGSAPPPSGPKSLRRPRRMRPAPTVRIVGFVTRSGATMTRLSVRAPRGVTISVRCTGDDCPRRALALATTVTRLRAFERHLAAGTRLEIRVTRAGYVGKHTLIHIRRGKPPSRRDRCLYPGSSAPRRCVG